MYQRFIHFIKHSLLASVASMNLYVPNPISVTSGIGQTLHRTAGSYDYCSMNVIAPNWAITVGHCGNSTNVSITPGYGRDETKPPNYPTHRILHIFPAPYGDDLQLIQFTPAWNYSVPIATSDIHVGDIVYLASQGFEGQANGSYGGLHLIRVGTSTVRQSNYPYSYFVSGYNDPPPPNHRTPNEAAAVLHDSGGGIYTVDATGHAQLHGVIISGNYASIYNGPGSTMYIENTGAENLFYFRAWINSTMAAHPISLISLPPVISDIPPKLHVDRPVIATPLRAVIPCGNHC